MDIQSSEADLILFVEASPLIRQDGKLRSLKTVPNRLPQISD